MTYPFDVIKTTIQGKPTETTPKQYDMLKKIVKQDGARGLFRGFSVTIIRGFIANAFTFYTNEMLHELVDCPKVE